MIHNRKVQIILVLLLLVASLALAAFMLQPSAADLLTDSAEAMKLALEETTTGHAVVEFELDMPEKSSTGVVEVWGQMGAGLNGEPAVRAEVLSASEPEMQGMVFVADGSQFWLWNPTENKVLTGTARELRAYMAEKMGGEEAREWAEEGEHEAGDHPQTAEEAVQKLLEYFTAERAGTETIGETEAFKLRLIPIPEQMPDEVRAAGGLLHVWLRPDDRLPVGAEYTGGVLGEGRAVATTLELNVALDASLFTFEIPAGAEVVRLADLQPQALSIEEAQNAADFDLLEPAGLPEGARLVEVVEIRGAIVQRYNLSEGGSFTLAQGPAGAAPLPEMEGRPVEVRGTTGTLFADEDGDRVLLTWQEGDVTFWLGGDITENLALRLANSLQ